MVNGPGDGCLPTLRRVDWKKSLNQALGRRGYQLQRVRPNPIAGPPRRGDRLLERPTFILCSVRSGSTLLRVLLSSHSMIHCPHELHLRHIGVSPLKGYPKKALAEVGLDRRRLRYLLWDRVLQRELAASGKKYLVNKTPNDVFIAERILECWPDARFIFLLRHPAAIARSRQALRPQDTPEQNAATVARYCNAVEEARRRYPGISVRYEDLATDPAAVTRSLCEFLEVPWEPAMLDYGEFAHGHFKAGLGDWGENIRSGRVQAPTPPPAADAIPPELVDVARAWGYLSGHEPVPQGSQATTIEVKVETRAEPPAL
jgi:hypothetical protein